MIEGFWIRNFRSVKRLGIGSCFGLFSVVDGNVDIHPFELGPMTLFTGGSGTGKSTVFDALAFLADCFHRGLDYACQKRGGFENLLCQGGGRSFSIGIDVRLKEDADTSTYAVCFGCDKNGIPFIESELLAIRRAVNPVPVIFLQNGVKCIRFLAPSESISSTDLTKVEFTDYKHLGLASLERHPQHPILATIRNLLENGLFGGWPTGALLDFDESQTKRQRPPRSRGISGLVRYIAARYGNLTPHLLERTARFLPNVEAIFQEAPPTGGLKLAFKMKDLERPVPMALLSEATLRLFAYALLLEEDEPAPLVVLKDPESGFDRPHLDQLCELIRRVIDFPRPVQLFVSTQFPELFEMVPPTSIWSLGKRSGEPVAERAE